MAIKSEAKLHPLRVAARKATEFVKPYERETVFELLEQAGFDLSEWGESELGKKAASNPKYCYNWSFEQPGTAIAVCIWYDEVSSHGNEPYYAGNMRLERKSQNPISARIWTRRANAVDRHLRTAYLDQLPVRALLLTGLRRNALDHNAKASRVQNRRLDRIPWAVTEYDMETGDFVITRGAKPVAPSELPHDEELESFSEGEPRRSFRNHRHRERRARRAKLQEAVRLKGRLICDVPNCGFDFQERYGSLGEGYAQVHHLKPLASQTSSGTKTKLSDLAVVCANCHAMIHVGGENRPLEGLIPDN
ncbi:HNH endonuclease [Bradyrhizobium sp. WSM2254]|uniref:HNH endonuclease n=1 Tax=Bradyrhizobium sp. WSM2254 TaxID=1188263 RepID=UPI0012EB1C8D|nr:HNH endonuclease [Bradyrhizobium sp. WSM2254]